MKKFFTSLFIIASFSFYAFFHNKGSVSNTSISTSPKTDLQLTPNTISVTPLPIQSTGTSTPTIYSFYKDGEYTGPAADAYYGNIQVKAVIKNGKISDIQFLQYPNDHHESIEINTRAMPILRREAIAAQSADVDRVTRATDTTIAFIESLTAALDQAKN